jgi:hypothetical protein
MSSGSGWVAVAGWQWQRKGDEAGVWNRNLCVKFEIGTIQAFVCNIASNHSWLDLSICGYLKVTPGFESLGDGLTDIATGI